MMTTSTHTKIAVALSGLALIGLHGVAIAQANPSLPRLRIHEDGRFLIKETGEPFVWVGETNWFFAEIDPERRDRMLDKRRDQGFTMLFISARENLYSGEGGPYGDNITDFNEPWWAYLEDYVDEAAKRGMYVGVTLGWWAHVKGNKPRDLYRNGYEAAQRLNGKTNVIWLVAGEAGGHSRDGTIPREKIEAIVKGIRDGDDDDKLLTIHADYRRGTSLNEDAELVDFNNWQTSQWCCRHDLPRDDEREWTVWEAIEFDYSQKYDTPSGVKPTLDAEAIYERNKDFCDATPFMVRRRAYFTILAGAFGHSYGAGGIWDTLDEPEGCSGSYLDALEYEGADDMHHLSAFLRSLGDDLLKLRPNQKPDSKRPVGRLRLTHPSRTGRGRILRRGVRRRRRIRRPRPTWIAGRRRPGSMDRSPHWESRGAEGRTCPSHLEPVLRGALGRGRLVAPDQSRPVETGRRCQDRFPSQENQPCQARKIDEQPHAPAYGRPSNNSIAGRSCVYCCS